MSEAAPDRAVPSRRLAAWERDPGCVVCEEPVAEDELDGARLIPFEDGDRVAHSACYAFRRQLGVILPPIKSDFGMHS